MLTDSQVERYSRQIILQPVGGRGQEALLRAAVAVVGEHDAATTAFVYLAAAGVGRLTRVSPLAMTDHVNPDVAVQHRPMPRDPEELVALASTHAVVVCVGAVGEIQATHDACRVSGRPLVWGFSAGPLAWASRLGDTPAHACPRCLGTVIGDPTARPSGEGIAHVAAAFVGTVLASEALKTLLGLADSLAGQCLTYDATAGAVECHPLAPVASCRACARPAGSSASGQS